MSELRDVVLRHWGVDPIAPGKTPGQMKRSEDPVETRQQARVIFVRRLDAFIRVVPVVKRRRGDQPLERAEAKMHVGVDKDREQAVDRDEKSERFLGEAEQVNRDDAADPDEGLVDGMHAARGGPVQVFARVVHGVKPPEQRYGVSPAVTPVRSKFVDENRGEELRPARQRQERLLQRRIDEKSQQREEHERHEQREQFPDAGRDKEMGHIRAHARALPKLPPHEGKQRFQRHENRHGDHEAQKETRRIKKLGHGGVTLALRVSYGEPVVEKVQR